ncbi:MAG TPA: hypothetical protein VFV50_06505 [Bdellovibrionales bacterium]|nr:hypothetical protein [Bdellovibrionales bacterium]
MTRFIRSLVWFPALFVLSIAAATQGQGLAPWLGPQRILVLPMSWADAPPTKTEAEIEKVLFEDNGPSLRRYFLENSMGAFAPTGRVLKWKQAAAKWSPETGCNPRAIARMAWELFKAEVNIRDYDSNGDGKIDHLFVLHSARIPHDRVGPDCVFGSSAQANQTAVFQTDGVGSIGNGLAIGFYIHEGGHEFYDFPDLYGSHYYGKYGIGMWGMMGLGCWGVANDIPREQIFRVPAHFEPLSKVRMGWVKPAIISQTTRSIRLRPVELTGELVKIPIGTRGSAYYLEYRAPKGFSAGHKGHGLLIWKDFEIIQADGRNDLNNGNSLGKRPLPPIGENFGDGSDPFPGSLGVTRFEDKTAGVAIENITRTGEFVSFDVVVKPGLMEPEVARPWYEVYSPRAPH